MQAVLSTRKATMADISFLARIEYWSKEITIAFYDRYKQSWGAIADRSF